MDFSGVEHLRLTTIGVFMFEKVNPDRYGRMLAMCAADAERIIRGGLDHRLAVLTDVGMYVPAAVQLSKAMRLSFGKFINRYKGIFQAHTR